MADERLSKFQRYTLLNIFKNGTNKTSFDKNFYNKDFFDSYTDSERVTVCKSYKNLADKGLIEKPNNEQVRTYILTEKGYKTLKEHEIISIDEYVNFKEYIENVRKERKALLKSLWA